MRKKTKLANLIQPFSTSESIAMISTFVQMSAAFMLVLLIAGCSTVKTQNETMATWFPDEQVYREMATDSLMAASSAGSAEAKLILAVRLMEGDRIEKNEARALAIFQDMAEDGDARAQYYVGVAYAQGAGVPQDEAAALEWFGKSAEAGYHKSQHWYGLFLAYGRGSGEPDWDSAIPWIERAARQGNPDSQFMLGEAYDSCRGGLPRDFDKAAYWYRIADGALDSDQDHMLARFNLRRLIDLGLAEWQEGDTGAPPRFLQPIESGNFTPCPKGVRDDVADRLGFN